MRPRKKEPSKMCKHCKKPLMRKRFGSRLEDLTVFSKRAFCNRLCMASSMEGVIKVVNQKNSYRQSSKAAKNECETCGKCDSRLHVHHVDGDPLNNDSDNLKTLCPECHGRIHSYMYNSEGTERLQCLHCEKKAIRKGLCHAHLTRLKRHGSPLAKKKKVGENWILYLDSQ